MTDPNPEPIGIDGEQGTIPPAPEEETPPVPDPTPAPVAVADDGAGSGWAVYDATIKRFVSGVLEKKPTKADVAKMGPKSHKLETRRV